MKSTESDVCYFEVDAVFNREPVELLEESTWTAGLRRTGNNTGEEVLCFLEFEDVFKITGKIKLYCMYCMSRLFSDH